MATGCQKYKKRRDCELGTDFSRDALNCLDAQKRKNSFKFSSDLGGYIPFPPRPHKITTEFIRRTFDGAGLRLFHAAMKAFCKCFFAGTPEKMLICVLAFAILDIRGILATRADFFMRVRDAFSHKKINSL